MSLLRRATRLLYSVAYLTKTLAPPSVVARHALGELVGPRHHPEYLRAQREFRASLPSYNFSQDWFTGNIPYWLEAFARSGFSQGSDLHALEIGSWEGLSSLFLLRTFERLQLTCVDTWEGADEHRSQHASARAKLRSLESQFDSNMSAFCYRLTKFRGTSYSFFDSPAGRKVFDLIYFDGSHHCDDVIVDAVKAFERLRIGGLLIFDDYMWRYYPREFENPAAAINVFLRLKASSYEIVSVYYQLILRKTRSDRAM